MTEQAFARELQQAVNRPGTNLEAISVPEPGEPLARRFRHNAVLVAQLMAVKLDVPQLRARRRAGPEEGVAAYGAAGDTIVKGRRRKGASWAA